MVGQRAYDWMYRHFAPWDSVGVRGELRALLDEEAISPETHPRSIDLGCGTGANVVFLAERGHDAFGVDFSEVALDKARQRAADAGMLDRTRFVQGDLTHGPLPGIEGRFDLLTDFGTLDDLRPEGRRAMAAIAAGLARPGAIMLFWCFYAAKRDLPWMSFQGPSRVAPAIEPGEEQDLFGADFDIRPGPATGMDIARCFVMTRH